MSPWLSSALADSRVRELRGEAARPRAQEIRREAACPPAREAWREAGRPRARRSCVRHRVGFALVEAGLHLLATASRN